MTRHYLGIGTDGPNTFRNVRKDETGEPLLLIDQDAVTTLQINFSDYLETGETIASATATGKSCTLDTVVTSPNITIEISSVTNYCDGSITLVATMSSGEVYRGIIRVRRTNRYSDEALTLGDYR